MTVAIPDISSPLPDRSMDQDTFDALVAAFFRTFPLTIAGIRAAMAENATLVTALLATVSADNSASTTAAQRYSALAQAAWAASMAPAEVLPAISQSMHYGPVVRAFHYDTSLDSDGGLWRKRCAQTSWYQEALNGTWLQQCPGEAGARAFGATPTGADLVVNGTFAANATSWTAGNNAAVSWDAGNARMLITNGAGFGYASQAITTVIGQTYRVSALLVAGTVASMYLQVGTAAGGNQIAQSASVANGTVYVSFVAVGTTTYLSTVNTQSTAGLTGYADNVSAKLVDTTLTVTGAYYQSTGDGKFYILSAGAGQVEVFRGNLREFPEQAEIVAEASRVVIYDTTQPTCPMWMVFRGDVSAYMLYGLAGISSVTAINGQLYVGSSSGTTGLYRISFIEDAAYRYTTGVFKFKGAISGRNTNLDYSSLTGSGIVNAAVNDVAATVLVGAPVDAPTGLPAPTVAVATAGGCSVFQNSGTIVTGATLVAYARAVITSAGDLILDQGNNSAALRVHRNIGTLGANFTQPQAYGQNDIPASVATALGVTALASGGKTLARGSISALGLVRENSASTANGMAAYITTAYNTGWMVGDIRGAWLADSVVETLSASSELVTNGTFTTDVSGWTAAGSAAVAFDTNRLKITNGAATNGYAYQAITTVIGRNYRVSVDFDRGSSSARVDLYIGTSSGSGAVASNGSTSATGNVTLDFVSTATTMYISLVIDPTNTHFAYFDNVTCKLAVPDRCVKNHGLVVNGAITKTLVASGADSVGYSGWSASNYLEQPYNSDLDFGTGDFCAMGWVNITSFAATSVLLHRAITTGGIELNIDSTTGMPSIYATASTTFTKVLTSTTALALNTWSHVCYLRASGVLYIYINGALIVSVANTTNLTYASATTRLGVEIGGGSPTNGAMALWRLGTTAPSAEQLAKIYRDESALLQSGSHGTLAGTSNIITALAHDDVTELLHVGTSWGRISFNKLVRVDSEATTIGALTTLAANRGAVLQGGASSGRFTQPALTLRDAVNTSPLKAKLGWVAYRATAPQVLVITSTQTFTPTVTGYYKVTVTGGGGGGATGNGSTLFQGAFGGASAIKWAYLTAGTVYTAAIGAGATARSGANLGGNAGGTSSFSGADITTITAPGGAGGGSNYGLAPSVGTGGDINIAGGSPTYLASTIALGGGSIYAGGTANDISGTTYGQAGGGSASAGGTSGYQGLITIES